MLIIVPVICSIILGIALYFEESLLSEFLSQAIYFLIAGIVTPLGILIWKKIPKTEATNTKLEKHTSEITKALKIIRKGYFGEDLDKIKFLVPYPYSEYEKERRRSDYPTRTELNEFFNRENWSDTDPSKYEFVSFDNSPEAEFQWAWKHLESYSDIQEKRKIAEKISIEFNEWYSNNKEKIFGYGKKLRKLQETDPVFHKKHNEIVEKTNTANNNLQKALDVLYHQLDDGETVKGKCELGY